MADDTVMIRVKRTTRDQLRAIAERIASQVEEGKREDFDVSSEVINPAGCGISLDEIIVFLIEQREGHRRRGAESSSRRKRTPSSDSQSTGGES